MHCPHSHRANVTLVDGFEALWKAATAAIGPEYFRLPVHGADPVYRERVYCYELYHQLRRHWPDQSRWRLNGEVDKRLHPYFAHTPKHAPKPDLLVHQPDTEHNYAVIEVKPFGFDQRGLCKDLRTLHRFQDFGYVRPIALMYGIDPPAAPHAFHRALATCEFDEHRIELWVHAAPGEPAQRVV